VSACVSNGRVLVSLPSVDRLNLIFVNGISNEKILSAECAFL
jgi:hypothetical protein